MPLLTVARHNHYLWHRVAHPGNSGTGSGHPPITVSAENYLHPH